MAAQARGPALMTTAEVATAFNVGAPAVRRWKTDGKLHPIRLPGGHYRYLRAEVDALINGTPLTPRQLRELCDLAEKEATS